MSDLPGCDCRRSLSVSGLAPHTLFSDSPATCGPALLERQPCLMHRYGMEGRGWIGRHGFWPLAVLWLPAGVVAQAAVRFPAGAGLPGDPYFWPEALSAAGSLVLLAPCGLPLALGCRRLWRLRYRRAAWVAGTGLGAVTVAASVVAGLLGPVAIAIYAVVLSLPVWAAWWWLVRRT